MIMIFKGFELYVGCTALIQACCSCPVTWFEVTIIFPCLYTSQDVDVLNE